MGSVRTKRVKIGAPTKSVGTFLTCMMLASCSGSQNAFFMQRSELIGQGYTWQKLDRCRLAIEDALSIPFIRPDGRKFVCYVLAPPRNGVAESGTAAIPPITPAPQSSALASPICGSCVVFGGLRHGGAAGGEVVRWP